MLEYLDVSNVQKIEDYAFDDCSSLMFLLSDLQKSKCDLGLHEDCTILSKEDGGYINKFNDLGFLTLGDSLIHVSKYLERLEIPDYVKDISYCAFEHANMLSLVISNLDKQQLVDIGLLNRSCLVLSPKTREIFNRKMTRILEGNYRNNNSFSDLLFSVTSHLNECDKANFVRSCTKIRL